MRAAYDEATSVLKRDACIPDYVPLFAAKRVHENLTECLLVKQELV